MHSVYNFRSVLFLFNNVIGRYLLFQWRIKDYQEGGVTKEEPTYCSASFLKIT